MSRRARIIELLVLYLAAPLALTRWAPGRAVLPVLWAATVWCWLALRRDPTFDRSRLWQAIDWRYFLRVVVPRFLVAAVVLTLLLLWYSPDMLLPMLHGRRLLLYVIIVVYPLLSVIPQGIVYRAFFFHRYRDLLPPPYLTVAGVVAFSFCHLPFRNLVAIGLTLVGGAFFVTTYQRTKSLSLSCLEHALYGDLLFILGYGPFIYHGTQALVSHVVR